MKCSPLRITPMPLVGLFLAAAACSHHGSIARSSTATAAEISVALVQTPDLAPDRWRGMSNIFFDALPPNLRDSIRTGDGWHGIGIAEMVASSGMRSIRAMRFTRASEVDTQYVVDTIGDLNFTRGRSLTFERRGAIRVANVELTVRTITGTQRRVPYQVLVADDGYTYARIADYRTGSISVDGRTYPVRVRNRGRSRPFFGANEYSVVMVDLNADGQFADQASLTVAGQALTAEQVTPRTPFVLNGRAFEVMTIDSAGTELRISRSNRTVAVTAGFRAPEIRATLLKGGEFRLSDQIGKVTLVEFWATDCVYSEKVRTAANALAEAHGERFTWIAVSKERDRATIEQHLVKAPMRATITLADSAAWETWNPAGATPFFAVVDQRGLIQFTAAGASAMDAATATVNRLLQSSLPP